MKRVARNEVSLGDGEADLIAIGELERMAARLDLDEAEAGMTPEQLQARDRAELQKIGGVGAKVAERFLRHGSPWAGARKHRELARTAPPIEEAVRGPSRFQAINADETQRRQEQLKD